MDQHHPAAARAPASYGGGRLAIREIAEAARFSLRIDPRALGSASAAYGVALPAAIGGTASDGTRTAICLGPDEWHLIAAPGEADGIEAAFAALYGTTIHSLVDIGHREVGFEVSGADAVLALQSAVAFDVEAMPVGSGCRTIMDKAQIVLLREASDRFRIEVWTSYADHVRGLLQAVGREVDLGV